MRASLQDSVIVKEKGVLNLKGGMLMNGTSVRLAGKTEVPACYILLPGHRRSFKKGELVEVHLVDPPYSHWSG